MKNANVFRCVDHIRKDGRGVLSQLSYYKHDCRCPECMDWFYTKRSTEGVELPQLEVVCDISTPYPPQNGVYLLLDSEEVVYVGQVSCYKGPYRVGSHRTKKGWEWDSQIFFPLNGFSKETISSIEGMFIDKFKPKYNKCGEKIVSCPELDQAIKQVNMYAKMKYAFSRELQTKIDNEARIMDAAIKKLNDANEVYVEANEFLEEVKKVSAQAAMVLFSSTNATTETPASVDTA